MLRGLKIYREYCSIYSQQISMSLGGGPGGPRFKGLGGASMILSRKGLDGYEEGVSLEERVFDGAFGGDGDEDFVMGEGVVVSSSLVKSTKSFLSRMMVSLIFLEGLEGEAWVKAIEVEEK
ncbi:hypothetical protein Tco_0191405 [Tanacetum coccineum]